VPGEIKAGHRPQGKKQVDDFSSESVHLFTPQNSSHPVWDGRL